MIEFFPNQSITSYSSSSDISSINSDSHHPHKPDLNTLSVSSGYDSSVNSIHDDFLALSPPPINNTSESNLVKQFIDLHLQKQSSYDHDIISSSTSSLSSSSSSFFSQELLLTNDSHSFSRKCLSHNQLSSDTDDDSQATTISTNLMPSKQKNKRPRSLPIAIQQPKTLVNDDDTDASSQCASLCCYSMDVPEKTSIQKCEFSSTTPVNGILSENRLIPKPIEKLDINEQIIGNQKNSLEHFIMSPTDKVKIQMKYQENDVKNVNMFKTYQEFIQMRFFK